MLTPKEKAIQLVDKYLKASFGVVEEYIPVPLPFAKQCALIALDLLLYYSESPEAFIEFEEIKKEIELL